MQPISKQCLNSSPAWIFYWFRRFLFLSPYIFFSSKRNEMHEANNRLQYALTYPIKTGLKWIIGPKQLENLDYDLNLCQLFSWDEPVCWEIVSVLYMTHLIWKLFNTANAYIVHHEAMHGFRHSHLYKVLHFCRTSTYLICQYHSVQICMPEQKIIKYYFEW